MLAAAAACAALCLAFALLPPLPAGDYLRTAGSGEVRDRDGALLHAFMNPGGQWCFPRPLDQISRRLVDATLAAEDRRFFSHPGVDPLAALRAAASNLSRGRIVSGASTITMQTVKHAEATPRTLAGKLGQAITALRLERTAGKDALLEAYLNNAPYGGNITGAEAAARRYFGKPASELSLPEAALLAGLPKSPTAFNPLLRPERALARRNAVLGRMRKTGLITEEEWRGAVNTPPGAVFHPFPKLAAHLAARLRREARESGAVATTLDAALQERVEQAARRYLKKYDGDITNTAVIVVDTETGEMAARAGSADFFGRFTGGQVDLCRAPRSPGSALKPFTYALALEEQRLYPTEQLLDRQLDYGTYNPANFSGDFNGLISATEALRLSLNVPAVMLLDRVGTEDLCAFLRRAGFSTLGRPAADYGLGLTLGNCEVTLEALAGAYLMLARLGEHRPLQWRADRPAPEGERLLSRGTALALYAMLDQPLPAELDRNLVGTGAAPTRVCWKTGTSTGFHDAWAVLFNRQYLVAVWMGNNSGRASRRLIGSQAALPLAAEIFRGLPAKTGPAWPDPAGETHEVEVCALTGLPADAACPAKSAVTLPKSLYLHRRCSVHQPGPEGGVGEFWPGSPRRWDLAAVPRGTALTTAPDPGAAQEARTVLAITSPPDNAEYVLTGAPAGDRIPLSAALNGSAQAHWYLDGKFAGTAGADAPLFITLTAGEHRATCMDAQGNTASARFRVVTP